MIAQDICNSAVILCDGSATSRTTIAATTNAGDPALSCGDTMVNNSVWFIIPAVDSGTCNVLVYQIDNSSGLSLEIFSGTCGSLVPIGYCTSGTQTIDVTFPTISNTLYYVMIDGENGNQEGFSIIANSADDAIIGRPTAYFDAFPNTGCSPLTVDFDNNSQINGGTGTTWEWRLNNGPYISSSGSDTTIVFSSIGTHTVTMRVCSAVCGCNSMSQNIFVTDSCTTQIGNIFQEDFLIAFPNPATDRLTISGTETFCKNIIVRSVSGRNVFSVQNFDTTIPLDISLLESGFYFLLVEMRDRMIVKRFVKE